MSSGKVDILSHVLGWPAVVTISGGCWAKTEVYNLGFQETETFDPGFKGDEVYNLGFQDTDISNPGFKEDEVYNPGFKKGQGNC